MSPSTFHIPHSRNGFTLLELLIFVGVFTLTSVSLVGVLMSVLRVQVRQSAAAEVNQQSQFLLQTVQRLVESSSLVEMPTDLASTTLKLRLASSTQDPTYIYESGGVVYIKQTDAGAPSALTSGRVIASNVSFIKRANVGGHDTVSVLFTIAYNSNNIQQKFSQMLDLAVARVSAATFDSNVVPAATNTYKLGASSQTWQSINDSVYFSGSNVGIGVSNPGQTLEINGGLRLNTTNVKPTCDATQRGTFWVTQSGSGVKDNAQVCVKNASDTYLWATIY